LPRRRSYSENAEWSAVGLIELMKHAGFTQGGFYNHFEVEGRPWFAEVACFGKWLRGLPSSPRTQRAPVDESTTALRRYISHYLSQAHRDDIDHGCPVAGFAGDVCPPRPPERSRITPAVWTIR